MEPINNKGIFKIFKGMLIMLFGGLICSGGVAFYFFLEPEIGGFAIIGAIAIGMVGVYFVYSGRYISYQGRCLLPLPAEELLKKDKRSPILYLRPFDLDESPQDFLNNENKITAQENYIINFFSGLGPIVTIGKPGEVIPSRGASRIYLNSSNWKNNVSNFLEKTKFVLLVLGFSPGILYEAKLVVKRIPPNRILLYIPVSDNRHEILKNLSKVFPMRTIPNIEHAINSIYLFVYFDKNWNPYVVSDSDGTLIFFSPKENCLAGLYPFLSQFGFKKRRRKLSGSFIGLSFFVIFMTCLFISVRNDNLNKKIEKKSPTPITSTSRFNPQDRERVSPQPSEVYTSEYKIHLMEIPPGVIPSTIPDVQIRIPDLQKSLSLPSELDIGEDQKQLSDKTPPES